MGCYDLTGSVTTITHRASTTYHGQCSGCLGCSTASSTSSTSSRECSGCSGCSTASSTSSTSSTWISFVYIIAMDFLVDRNFVFNSLFNLEQSRYFVSKAIWPIIQLALPVTVSLLTDKTIGLITYWLIARKMGHTLYSRYTKIILLNISTFKGS